MMTQDINYQFNKIINRPGVNYELCTAKQMNKEDVDFILKLAIGASIAWEDAALFRVENDWAIYRNSEKTNYCFICLKPYNGIMRCKKLSDNTDAIFVFN